MNSKPIKIPGPDHPITITPTKGRVTVTVNGKRIADTREAQTLKEAAYPVGPKNWKRLKVPLFLVAAMDPARLGLALR